jgi:hypothetical protein
MPSTCDLYGNDRAPDHAAATAHVTEGESNETNTREGNEL